MHVNHKILGVVFICLLLAGVWLTYGIFTKKFVDYDRVTLRTSTLGLQLPERADVKIRGVIVGEVLGFTADPDGAEVTLGLYPDQIDIIPANVTGSIVPKTLFGEKYVALEVPADPSPEPHQGRRDHRAHRRSPSRSRRSSTTSIHCFAAVQPAEINQTLNAIATALEGRGELIGENFETVDAYLKRLNPQIPAIVEDLRLTARVSTTYADVMPEIAQILRNTIKTTGTLEDREQQLKVFFSDLSAFSDDTRVFLDQNGDNIIRLGQLGAQQLRLLAKYAPEYPCLTGGIVNAGKLQAEAFRGFTLHIVLETLPNQPRGYNASDVPRLGEDGGPACLNLPNPPWTQANPLSHQRDFDDGVDSPTGKGISRVAPGSRELHRQSRRGERAQGTPRPRSRPVRRRRTRPGRAARGAHGSWGGGDAPVKALDTRTTVDLVKLVDLHGGDHGRDQRPRRHDRQPRLRDHPRVQGGVHRRHRRGQGRRHPHRRGQGRHRQEGRDRRAHPRADHVLRPGDHVAVEGDPCRHPLPQPGRPALHLAEQPDRRQRTAGRGRHDPGRPDLARPRPDCAVQRLQAAVRGVDAERHQHALLRDRPGLPGRGRHARRPAGPHRVGHRHARRPRRRSSAR